MLNLKQVFTTADGKIFDNKADALNYLRKPAIRSALNVITQNNTELTDWLIDNEETVQVAFETGSIKRVTKADHSKLAKALEAIVLANDPKFAFVAENKGAILDSFRWPSVKRMDDAEKATAARNTLVAASEGNAELAEWVLANKDLILSAYEAGVEKRAVSPKATEALAAYRAKKAEEKAAAEANKA